MGSFVIGLEGDGDYNSTNNNGFKSDWLATVRGRAGWAWDRVLFYGTGGAAFAPASVGAGSFFAGSLGGSATMTGWTAGGGVEYAFTPNWTAKAEYLYSISRAQVSAEQVSNSRTISSVAASTISSGK